MTMAYLIIVSLSSSLAENTLEGTSMHIVSGVTGDRNSSLLDRMLVLAVTASLRTILHPSFSMSFSKSRTFTWFQVGWSHGPCLFRRGLPQQLLHVQIADQPVQIV